jgi:PKD repeat protein
MAITRVGGSANAAITSVVTLTVTIPSGIVTGDVGLIVAGYNPTTSVPTTPTGWTASTPVSVGGSSQFVSYTKDLTPAEAGTVVTLNLSAAQRIAAVLEVYRGSTYSATSSTPETVSASTHANPSSTAPTGGGVTVSMVAERSSTPSTSFTQPSGYALRDSGFGTGSGAVSVAAADNLTNVTAGGAVGGGTWSASTANAAAIVYLFRLANAASTPLVAAELAITPLTGAAPLTVAATTAATGGTGVNRTYTFDWDDGATTGPQSGSTSSHTFTTAGTYDVTYTVTES